MYFLILNCYSGVRDQKCHFSNISISVLAISPIDKDFFLLVLVLLKIKNEYWFRKQMKLSIHQRKHRQTCWYPSVCFYFHQHFKSLHTLLQLGVSSFKEKKHEHWFRKQMKLSIHQRKHIQTCRYPSVCFYSHQYFKSLHTLLQFCNFCLVNDFASIDTKHVYSMSILD